MHINNPLDGIKIGLDWADIWIGYTLFGHSRIMGIQLHIHYLPDTDKVRKKIYARILPYLWSRKFYLRKGYSKFINSTYRGHGEYGRFLGPILDGNNEKIADILNNIQHDGAKLMQKLECLLKEIFKD